MNNIKDIIDHITEGIGITDEQKQVLEALYMVSLYKLLLEMLIGFKAGDVRFYQTMDVFFSDAINSLSPQERKHFNELLEQHKEKALTEVLSAFKSYLTPELRQKMEANIELETARADLADLTKTTGNPNSSPKAPDK